MRHNRCQVYSLKYFGTISRKTVWQNTYLVNLRLGSWREKVVNLPPFLVSLLFSLCVSPFFLSNYRSLYTHHFDNITEKHNDSNLACFSLML